MTAGQAGDHTGASTLASSLSIADRLLGGCGYDAHWFRKARAGMGTTSCIPRRKSHDKAIKYDKRSYKKRNQMSSCLTASKTGNVLQRVMTYAQRSFILPLLSHQLCYSGYEP